MTEQPRQEFDLRHPFRTQPDGGPCWCVSTDEPHAGWIHSPLCAEMFRRWWAGEDVERREPLGLILWEEFGFGQPDTDSDRPPRPLAPEDPYWDAAAARVRARLAQLETDA